MIVYIIAALLVFGVLIAVHELGHFLAAKACGVRVNEFAIGMGPVLWKKQKGETLYSLRAFPVGGFCAMEEGLERADAELLLLACSYHDVGRQNDWVDDLHGWRSAQRIGEITGRTGDDLHILQGMVDAHSRHEPVLRETVAGYHPAEPERAVNLAQLLKDADGLDRVRLGDLDPRYLRRESSKRRADLAFEVFQRYQIEIGLPPKPFFTPEEISSFRAHKDTPKPPEG